MKRNVHGQANLYCDQSCLALPGLLPELSPTLYCLVNKDDGTLQRPLENYTLNRKAIL